AFALGKRHREELALLAADEHAVDADVVDPMTQIPPQTGSVDRAVGQERRLRRRPDAAQVGAGVVFGVLAGEIHSVTCWVTCSLCAILQRFWRLVIPPGNREERPCPAPCSALRRRRTAICTLATPCLRS